MTNTKQKTKQLSTKKGEISSKLVDNTPYIEELKWETGLDMLMTELVTCAGIGMAEKHRRQRIIKFVTKTIESERKKVVKEMKKLYSLNKSDAYNNAITDAIKLLK